MNGYKGVLKAVELFPINKNWLVQNKLDINNV